MGIHELLLVIDMVFCSEQNRSSWVLELEFFPNP